MPKVSVRLRVKMPAEPALDQNRIVQTALKLLDEVGLEGLTMRRLAEKLNIKAASLYWHVRDKDELIALLANEICAQVSIPDPTGSWRKQLEHFADEYRHVLMSHRDAARVLVMSGPPSGANRLDLLEIWLGTLLKVGFSHSNAVFASFLLNDYVTMFVMEETRYVEPPAEQGEAQADSTDNDWIDLLPRDKYPNIALLAPHLLNINMDEQFRFGVEVLLDGIERKLAAQT